MKDFDVFKIHFFFKKLKINIFGIDLTAKFAKSIKINYAKHTENKLSALAPIAMESLEFEKVIFS
jgi:hypothetical protein